MPEHDLKSEVIKRKNHYHSNLGSTNLMISVYNGIIPGQWRDLFPPGQHVPLFNAVRQAVDDLANLTGKVFSPYIPPMKNTDAAKKRSEKAEQVLYGYNDAAQKRGGLSMDNLMDMLGWWLVLSADAVAVVFPDYERKTPFFHWKDPRTHLPPVGWTPWSLGELDGTMFVQTWTMAELKLAYLERAADIDAAYKRGDAGHHARGDETELEVCEYYSKDRWCVEVIGNKDTGVTLFESKKGQPGHPGICPVVPFTLYNPSMPKGRPLFLDHIPLQMFMARTLQQQVQAQAMEIGGEVFSTPVVGGSIRTGPGAVNMWDPNYQGQHRAERLAPKNTSQAMQTAGMLHQMLRIANRNPESMQGGGDANSAKALNELKAGVHQTVEEDFWPAFINGLPKLYAKAMQMDINLWGNVKKEVDASKPRGNNRKFSVNYRPRQDLSDYVERVSIEKGIGLKGYQGRLEVMQLVGSNLMSRATALEQLDTTLEPVDESRRISIEQMEEVEFQALLMKAQSGELNPDAFAEIRKRIEDGMSRSEAIADVSKAGLLYPPPAPEAAPAMDPLAALMGGGGPQMEPPPLDALRAIA